MKPRERLRMAALVHAPRLFLRFGNPTSPELGACGEELAARHLARRGFELIGRRVSTPHAEIDLVARCEESLVCVEVKTGRIPLLPRTGIAALRFRPGDRLSQHRLERQRRAGLWLARHLERGRLRGGRVDLCEVLVLPSHRLEFIHHANLAAALV